MHDGRQLKEVIAEGMDAKGFTVKKLAEATGVAEGYLKLFADGDLRKLPPAPYVRGYLTKIAHVTDLDRDDLWHRYRSEIGGLGSSGPADRLPNNRFAIKTQRKKLLLAGTLAVMIAAYLGWNARALIGVPRLTLTEPAEETTSAAEPSAVIAGRTDSSAKLTINGEQLYLEGNGQFRKEYALQEGLNNFEVIAKKFLGGQAQLTRKIIFQKPQLPSPVSETPSSTGAVRKL